MSTLTVIIICLWILTVLGYAIFNLYNKNLKLEKMVVSQSDFISDMQSSLTELDKVVDQIDTKIWVQSDPEILIMFDKVKEIQSIIKQFQRIK